jgi:cell division septum initiation protein DivIVA
LEYEAEVIKIIRGESKLNPDLLNKLYEDAKVKAADAEQGVKQLEDQIQDGEKMKDSLSQQFDNLRTWADMYDECDMETKKMILARIMEAVRVRRDYEIEIDFTVDFEKIGGIAHLGPMQEKAPVSPAESAKKAVLF